MSGALELAALIIAAFFGGIARYWVSGAIARRVGETFPWGTLVVNLSGAFAIGLLAGSPVIADDTLRLVLISGFLGCYTTVSSFALQTFNLLRGREWRAAVLNLLASILFGLSACALGLLLAGAFA